jgi:hypothetical protein
MNKISKVKSLKFTSEWKSPTGTNVYYHEIEFENGDTGNVGRNKKMPDDMAIGVEIEYQISDKKVKYIKTIQSNVNNSYNRNNNNSNNKFVKYNGKKSPQEFLGYAYAYAKDMVVAGKTSNEDIANLQTIAESIYNHIKILLLTDED